MVRYLETNLEVSSIKSEVAPQNFQYK